MLLCCRHTAPSLVDPRADCQGARIRVLAFGWMPRSGLSGTAGFNARDAAMAARLRQELAGLTPGDFPIIFTGTCYGNCGVHYFGKAGPAVSAFSIRPSPDPAYDLEYYVGPLTASRPAAAGLVNGRD